MNINQSILNTEELNHYRSMKTGGLGHLKKLDEIQYVNSTISIADKSPTQITVTNVDQASKSDMSEGTHISTTNMDMSYICGNGMHGLFDWAKSQVMEDFHLKKKAFEKLDKDGNHMVYSESQVYEMIEAIKNHHNGRSDKIFEKSNMRTIFKKSF